MASWTVQSGTWSDDGGSISTESTNARIQLNTAHPDSVAAHYVEVDITFSSRGDRAGIMLSGDLFCEVQWCRECTYPSMYAASLAYCGTLRIWSGSTLLKTLRHVQITSDTITLKAGYIRSASKVWVQLGSYCLHATTNTPTSYYVGLGTGSENDGGVSFDNFYFYKGKTSGNDCEDACTETTDPVPCVIAQAPTGEIKTIVTDDICCDWTKTSGSWSCQSFTLSGVTYSRFLTSSTNALIECDTEQVGVSEFGYMKCEHSVYAREGTVVRIYLDYASTSSCHLAEFTTGAQTTGSGGRIVLKKNGVTIADEAYNIPALAYNKLSVCLVPDDASPLYFDLFFADVNSLAQASGSPDTGGGVLAATTVNGNKRCAFGTGGYVNSTTHFRCGPIYHTITLDDDTECTPCYTEPECEPCPGGDGPDTGMSFDITGFSTKYGRSCDCTDFNSTFNIAGACSGSMTTGTLCTEDGKDYYLVLDWEITVATGNYWFLWLDIYFKYGTNTVWRCTYIREFDDQTLCRTISGESMSLQTEHGTGYEAPCDGMDELTIEATAY